MNGFLWAFQRGEGLGSMMLVKHRLHPERGCRSPRPARIRIQRRILHHFQHHPHRSMRMLCIRQNIAALLQEHTRHAIPDTHQRGSLVKKGSPKRATEHLQQVPLEPQRHRSARIDDGLTCLRHVHLADGFLVDPLQLRRSTQRRNKPAMRIRRAR